MNQPWLAQSLSFTDAEAGLWPLGRGRTLQSTAETTVTEEEKCAYTTWMKARYREPLRTHTPTQPLPLANSPSHPPTSPSPSPSLEKCAYTTWMKAREPAHHTPTHPHTHTPTHPHTHTPTHPHAYTPTHSPTCHPPITARRSCTGPLPAYGSPSFSSGPRSSSLRASGGAG